jgi:hypothetical protein
MIASDNCTAPAALTIMQNPPAGTLVGLGDYPLTITVTDEAGHSNSCTATLTVVDDTPPQINFPADITLPAGSGCQATLAMTVTATDACDPSPRITSNPPLPATFGIGRHTVTFTATDNAGNVSRLTTTVTVVSNASRVNAGPDQFVDEKTEVTLVGSVMEPAPDQTFTFQWTQTGGPPVTLSGANTSTATFTAPDVTEGTCGVLIFRLQVTDSCGGVANDTVVVRVSGAIILQDNRSNNCLRVDACRGTYTFVTARGQTYTGPVVITPSGNFLSFTNTLDNPITLEGSVNLVERTGSARLRISLFRSFGISDRNIDDNDPCP